MDIAAAASLLSAKNAVGKANAMAGIMKKSAEAERSLLGIIEQNIEASKPAGSAHSGSVDILA